MVFRKKRKSNRRSFFGRAKSYGRRTAKNTGNLLMDTVPYALYGVVRSPISGIAQNVPVLKDLPISPLLKDNVTLGTIGCLAAVFGNGMIRKAGKTVLNSEVLLTAIDVSSGMTSSTSSDEYTYG